MQLYINASDFAGVTSATIFPIRPQIRFRNWSSPSLKALPFAFICTRVSATVDAHLLRRRRIRNSSTREGQG
jgi:hypothetical protein